MGFLGGLKTTLFGGGGFSADKPDFRNFSEFIGQFAPLALIAKEDPKALVQMFNTKPGRDDLKKLGFENIDQLTEYLKGAGPNVVGSEDYQQLAGDYGGGLSEIINQMRGISGDLTDYGADFKLDDISNIPDEVYAQMQQAQEEQAARGLKGALRQLGSQYGSRGFRAGSGFEQMSGSGMGRNFLEQLKNISTDIGSRKAESKLDTAKFMSNQRLARQSQRENYLTQLQQYAKNFGMQNLQNQANIANQRMQGMTGLWGLQNEAALRPYSMYNNYYGSTAGLNQAPSKGLIGTVAEAAAPVATAALLKGHV